MSNIVNVTIEPNLQEQPEEREEQPTLSIARVIDVVDGGNSFGGWGPSVASFSRRNWN